MTLRQVPVASSEEKIANVEQGLVKGKEAVSMDTTDGQSWSLLGNAYLSHFFQVIVSFEFEVCCFTTDFLISKTFEIPIRAFSTLFRNQPA